MTIDTERLKTDREYWGSVAPRDATHAGLSACKGLVCWYKKYIDNWLYLYSNDYEFTNKAWRPVSCATRAPSHKPLLNRPEPHPITLRPGDHILTEDEWPEAGRTLPVHQVLTATNAGGADADGWIPKTGESCPVDPDTPVEVKFRSGSSCSDHNAGTWAWVEGAGEHTIIAYRLHQPDAKQWRGPQDGLPPVGTTCEYMTLRRWNWCQVVAHDRGLAVVRTDSGHYHLRGLPADTFRPIHSDRERVIEAAWSVFKIHADSETAAQRGLAKLYDCGMLSMPKDNQ